MPDLDFPVDRDRAVGLKPSLKTYVDLVPLGWADPHSPTWSTAREWPLGEGLILLAETGVLFALDADAARVWRLRREGLDGDDVVRRVAADLDLPVDCVEAGCALVMDRLRVSGYVSER